MRGQLIQCACEHKGQDEIYGKGRRYGNPIKGGTSTKFRCTVCGKESA